MKLKDRIRERLRTWLFKEEIYKIESAENNYKIAEDAYDKSKEYLNVAKGEYVNSLKMIDDCKKMMNSVIDVGVDVGFHTDDHSWAVVCIKGHPEYVKFLPLSHKSAQEILQFLKRFEYSDKVIDSLFFFKDMVDRYVIKSYS